MRIFWPLCSAAEVVIPFLLSVPRRVKTNVFSEKRPSWYSHAQAVFERGHCGNGTSGNFKPLSLSFAFPLWAASSQGCVCRETLFESPGETLGSFAFSSLSCPQAQAAYSVCSVFYTPHSLLCHCYSPNTQRVLNPWVAFYWETEVIYKDLNSVK